MNKGYEILKSELLYGKWNLAGQADRTVYAVKLEDKIFTTTNPLIYGINIESDTKKPKEGSILAKAEVKDTFIGDGFYWVLTDCILQRKENITEHIAVEKVIKIIHDKQDSDFQYVLGQLKDGRFFAYYGTKDFPRTEKIEGQNILVVPSCGDFNLFTIEFYENQQQAIERINRWLGE